MSDPIKDIAEASEANARRGAQRRMFWKLCAVLVAVAAYSSLRGLEAAKHSYDEQQSRPVVIVDDTDAERVAKELSQEPREERQAGTSRLDKVAHDARLLKLTDVESAFNQTTLAEIKEPITKIKYQSFKDDKQIVDRLDEEILAEAEYNKKSFLAVEEAENKAQASKLPDLSQDRISVTAKLKEIYQLENQLPVEQKGKEDEFTKWIDDNKVRAKNPSNPTQKDIANWRAEIPKTNGKLDKENLLRWLMAIDRQSNDQGRLSDIKRRIESIDYQAQKLIRAVYTELKPKLPELLKGAVNAPPQNESVLAFFSPRSVLDANSGIHVIYQTLWLACVMILVFALIFVLLIALRPLPYFAHGTDALMEHAGELFKRSEGTAPQLAKSLVVTAAALGIGTAVAISSTSAVSKIPRGVTDSGYAETYEQGNGQPGMRGRPGRPGVPGEGNVVEHVVTFSPPIVYPSPVTVAGPDTVTINSASLDPLRTAIANLKLTSTTPVITDTELRQRMTDVAKYVTADAITAKIGTVDVPKLYDSTTLLKNDVMTAQGQVDGLVKWKTLVEKNFADTLASFKDQLANTNSAVQDIRDNSFERSQNSGGRNLLTRTAQVFKADKYLVTTQSVKALRSLMIKLPLNDCPTSPGTVTGAPTKEKCCGTEHTSAEYSCDLDIDAMFRKLSSMVGDSPKNESEFINELYKARRVDGGQIRKTIQQWRSVILKYTRVAY